MRFEDDRRRAFFGRRHGKALRPRQRTLLGQLLPKYLISLDSDPPADIRNLFDAPVGKVWMEIGFGGGEHLLHRLRNEPETGFIGVEPFVNGMAKMLAALGDDLPSNLRLFDDDATALLDWLPPGSVHGLDLLYPDPWPKRKHWKRRFVNGPNLDRFARVMIPGSIFRFASDIETYVNWTLLHCRRHEAFVWQAQGASDWREPYQGWPGTRYEAKALHEGRQPTYLRFLLDEQRR